MSKFIGRDLAVGIGKETSRGVGVTPTHWLSVTNFSYFDRAVKARSTASTGGIWGGDQSYVARKYAEGEIECELDDKSFGLIAHATFGSSSSASYNGAYKHSYTLLNSAEHPSLSISTSDPNSDNIFEMSMVDTLTMNFTPEALVTYTVGFKSKSSASSSVTASYPANNKFLGRQLSVYVASDTSGLDAATKLTLESATLNITKNTDYYNVVGSVQPSDINNKLFTITGEMTISFENNTYRDYMLDGTYKAVRFDLVNDDVTIGTTNPSFRLDLSKVDFDAWDVDYSLDEIVMQTINFTALYDLGGNDNLINDCYVVNEIASY
jgi:hypothetical protein